MWKSLFSSLLVFYAVAGAELAVAEPRIMTSLELAVEASGTFGRGNAQGLVREDGTWQLRYTVFHSRLRCGTYETGIQLGKGAQGCAQAEWLNEVQYGSSRRQCNSATLIHNASGSFDNPGQSLQGANCVRVVVRCTGTCG